MKVIKTAVKSARECLCTHIAISGQMFSGQVGYIVYIYEPGPFPCGLISGKLRKPMKNPVHQITFQTPHM